MQNNIFSGQSLRQKLIVFDEIGSTNDYLKTQLSNFKPLPEWSAIMAKFQSNGRGQRQNSWKVEPNTNITFSFVIYPSYLNPQQHFILNMLVSVGIIDWLKSLNLDALIKWPNDILLSNKKISGILIENKINHKEIKQSVIGIGVNVNQKRFPDELDKIASSVFNESGILTKNLEEECLNLFSFIANRIENYKTNNLKDKDLLEQYNNLLFRKNIPALYTANSETFEAVLTKVDENGLLHLLKKNKEETYFFKEVVFVMQ